MAGTPTEDPTKFVCIGCQNILAGIPASEGPPYSRYDAPSECGACGSENVVPLSHFDRHWAQQD
jgi:hypothetical protein